MGKSLWVDKYFKNRIIPLLDSATHISPLIKAAIMSRFKRGYLPEMYFKYIKDVSRNHPDILEHFNTIKHSRRGKHGKRK